jgi:hypothetical protein
VYALAAGGLPERMRVGRLSLRVFSIGSIAAIAGAPGGATASEEALREQHAIVVALAERVDPLLPARFGSHMTAARLEAVISGSSAVLSNALEHVRGRRQMTVRLTGPATVEAPEPPPASGTAYLARRRAGHSLPAEARPLEAGLQPFVVDRRVQPGRGAIRATVFHLVPRDDVAAYRAAFEQVAPRLAPWRAALSGPWPAFAFAPELDA